MINEGDVSLILGSRDVIELPPRRDWTKETGVVTVRRFAGEKNAISERFNELTASTDPGGDRIIERSNGKVGELEIMIEEDSGGSAGGNTDALNAIWELRSNTVLKPIESRREFDTLNTLDGSTSMKRKIESAARNAEANPYPITAAAIKLYAYYSNQILDYYATDLMLTKSTTVSSRSALTATYTNLNRVVSVDDIDPPYALLGAMTSLPKSDGSGDVGWEWLYLGPQVRQLTRTRYQIILTWHGAERWAEIYGGTWKPEGE